MDNDLMFHYENNAVYYLQTVCSVWSKSMDSESKKFWSFYAGNETYIDYYSKALIKAFNQFEQLYLQDYDEIFITYCPSADGQYHDLQMKKIIKKICDTLHYGNLSEDISWNNIFSWNPYNNIRKKYRRIAHLSQGIRNVIMIAEKIVSTTELNSIADMILDAGATNVFLFAIAKEKRKESCDRMLIEELTEYCDCKYREMQCIGCDHSDGCPNLQCPENCKTCLKEIHYPDSNPNGRKDYNCKKLMYYYVCDYTFKYASEIYYLLEKSEKLKEISQYNIYSVGCGACPDLMAFEKYCSGKEKNISYVGVDINELWKPIHNAIEHYRSDTVKNIQFGYFDAISNPQNVNEANVIVLQYLLSHIVLNQRKDEISIFFDKLIQYVVLNKKAGVPMVILINDINHYQRGRDDFQKIMPKLREKGFDCRAYCYYFDYMINNPQKKYGSPHETIECCFDIPESFNYTYEPWKECSSAQLLIEIE